MLNDNTLLRIASARPSTSADKIRQTALTTMMTISYSTAMKGFVSNIRELVSRIPDKSKRGFHVEDSTVLLGI